MQTDRPQAPEPMLFEGAEPQAGGSRALAIAGALVIGLLSGFAGGFMVGQRGAIPEPREAAAVATPSETFTEAAIAEPAPTTVEEPTLSPDPVAVRPTEVVAPDTARATEQVVAQEPAVLNFASRPAGAQVFFDGAPVGRTPLVMRDVKTGSHRVRLELAGHRTWATVVSVEPGSNQRVGASLEP